MWQAQVVVDNHPRRTCFAGEFLRLIEKPLSVFIRVLEKRHSGCNHGCTGEQCRGQI